MTYKQALWKRKIEGILVYPFVLCGKLFGWFFPLKTRHGIFIFCPSADIGGANLNNADIAKCFRDKNPLVIFSKKPRNNALRHLFDQPDVRVMDLHKLVDHKGYHFINMFFRGVISTWINREKEPLIFGGESLYFYKVLPYIKKEVRTADLSHLDTWFNYTQPFIKDIDKRIFSTPYLKRKAATFYKQNHLPEELVNRLYFIDNATPIPPFEKIENTILQIVFIGRGAPQKRVYLIAEIAKKIHELNLNIHISFAGDVSNIINPEDYPYCTFFGNIQSREKMDEIQTQSDVLLLTSAFEGLPMSVMEMMARGKVVVATAVGGIPDYITNGENGFLLENNPDEDKIVEEAVAVLSKLSADKNLMEIVGRNSRLYAENHFSEKVFKERYGEVLFGS